MVLSVTPAKKVIAIVVLHKRHVYREMMQISEGLETPISFGVLGMCMKSLLTKLFIAFRRVFAQIVVSCGCQDRTCCA
jgi:hypothetical protein